jgi:hypothetical protein
MAMRTALLWPTPSPDGSRQVTAAAQLASVWGRCLPRRLLSQAWVRLGRCPSSVMAHFLHTPSSHSPNPHPPFSPGPLLLWRLFLREAGGAQGPLRLALLPWWGPAVRLPFACRLLLAACRLLFVAKHGPARSVLDRAELRCAALGWAEQLPVGLLLGGRRCPVQCAFLGRAALACLLLLEPAPLRDGQTCSAVLSEMQQPCSPLNPPEPTASLSPQPPSPLPLPDPRAVSGNPAADEKQVEQGGRGVSLEVGVSVRRRALLATLQSPAVLPGKWAVLAGLQHPCVQPCSLPAAQPPRPLSYAPGLPKRVPCEPSAAALPLTASQRACGLPPACPQTRLWFAGEATSKHDAYTVHGAYATGEGRRRCCLTSAA